MGERPARTLAKGRLGFGTIGSTAVLLTVLIAMVAVTAWNSRRSRVTAI